MSIKHLLTHHFKCPVADSKTTHQWLNVWVTGPDTELWCWQENLNIYQLLRTSRPHVHVLYCNRNVRFQPTEREHRDVSSLFPAALGGRGVIPLSHPAAWRTQSNLSSWLMSVGWRGALTLCSMIYECESKLNDTSLTRLEICTTSVSQAPVFLSSITAEMSTSCQHLCFSIYNSVSVCVKMAPPPPSLAVSEYFVLLFCCSELVT